MTENFCDVNELTSHWDSVFHDSECFCRLKTGSTANQNSLSRSCPAVPLCSWFADWLTVTTSCNSCTRETDLIRDLDLDLRSCHYIKRKTNLVESESRALNPCRAVKTLTVGFCLLFVMKTSSAVTRSVLIIASILFLVHIVFSRPDATYPKDLEKRKACLEKVSRMDE